MSIWTDFGFRASPYGTEPIPATEEGDRLLVGRDKPLSSLMATITSSALHPTIEGDNGVGKTSLVSVASYRLHRKFQTGETGQALIPLRSAFQLSASDTADSFAHRVYYEIAQGFIEHEPELRARGIDVPSTAAVDKWLNSPVFTTTGGGGSILGNGAEFTRGTEPGSSGFGEAGFASAVRTWLASAFPDLQAGGFVCVIDNLELLETSKAARTLLESMRDGILAVKGLRWVLCGARGIMRTTASSQRLEGRLREPMDLAALPDVDVEEVMRRRIEVFGVGSDVLAPVGPRGFRHIYELLNRNLRNALKYCEDFAFWLHENQDTATTDDEVFALFEVWLTTQSDAAFTATTLTPKAWEVFDGIVSRGGSISPSDHPDFGFKEMANMRPYIKALEETQLVVSSVDESDKRRRTIGVTSRGWMVNYARSGYKLPERLTS
ncbi:hypothetical protein [Microbacterium lacticum]|uniref:hypothetical protein n=1 Tax=Microbacterium lacticum TaxID=33885 RepID=UPI0028D137FD|nr:hypothetical protein [Microbacterium lacticum]